MYKISLWWIVLVTFGVCIDFLTFVWIFPIHSFIACFFFGWMLRSTLSWAKEEYKTFQT